MNALGGNLVGGVADASALLETMDGDVEEAARLADLFFETGEEQMRGLQAALKDEDRDAMIFNVHKCAGGAAACGFELLADQLYRFECEGRDMDWEKAATVAESLIETFEKTKRDIKVYFQDKRYK